MRRTGARARRIGALERAMRATLALVVAGAGLAAARALVWPRGPLDAALVGLPRAAILFAIGASTAGLLVALWSWRRARTTPLHAARTIDLHLGLADVVASALAFETDATQGPAAELTRRRAHVALQGFDPRAAIPRPSLRPRLRRLLALGLVASLGVGLGTLDSTVVAALVAPPTPGERAAAAALDDAARALEAETREPDRTQRAEDAASREPEAHDDDRAIAAQARQVAAATRRGDRDAALRALREMDAARERAGRRVRRATERLAAIASALGAPPRGGSDRAPSASEHLRELARLLQRREPRDDERPEAHEAEQRRMLERLERAASQAPDRVEDEVARALERAAAAIAAGDAEAAAEAMEQAARALERREAQLARAQAMQARRAALAERAGAAERALQLARVGRTDEEADAMLLGEEGDGGAPIATNEGGRQLSESLMSRLTALGLARGPSTDPRGGGGGRRAGQPEAPLPARTETHARSDVNGVGERAIAALEGLGANGEPTAELREVFPSYGVQVEEALADERIPAPRRRTVRRYFESIRPEGDTGPEGDTEEEPR